MKDRPKIKYFNTAFLPIYFGFCTDPTAFAKEMKRLKVDPAPKFLSDAAFATTHCLTRSSAGLITIIVCINPKRKPMVLPACLAHEATHVFQFAMEKMGEDKPGDEIQAYAIQYFTELMWNEVTRK